MTRTQLRNIRFVLLGLMLGNIIFISNAVIGMLIGLVLITAYLILDIRFNPYASIRQIKMNKILLAIYGFYALINIVMSFFGFTVPTIINVGIMIAALVVIVKFSNQY